MAAVQPSALRATDCTRHSLILTHDGAQFQVTNHSIMRHSVHVLIWTSAIANARQRGSSTPFHFTRPSSPFIRKAEVICGYGTSNITAQELDSLPREELEYTLTARQCWHYKAYHYDGENVGRYINQGGLRKALGLMVNLAASRDYQRTGFSLVEAEAEAEWHCNTKFDYKATYDTVLLISQDVQLGPTPVELYVNYGIQGYRVPYLAYHATDCGLQHDLVRAILWCATSRESSCLPTSAALYWTTCLLGLWCPKTSAALPSPKDTPSPDSPFPPSLPPSLPPIPNIVWAQKTTYQKSRGLLSPVALLF